MRRLGICIIMSHRRYLANPTAAAATTMTMMSGTAASRINSPNNSKSPPRNSIVETKGARMLGNGIPQPTKFPMTAGRSLSFPQPLQRKTRPFIKAGHDERAENDQQSAESRLTNLACPNESAAPVHHGFTGGKTEQD